MVHKLALLIGGVASLGVLAFAVAGSGFFSATPAAAVDQPAPAAQSNDGAGGGLADQAAPQKAGPVKTVIDKVYVAPTPKAKVVRVAAPANPQAQRPAQNTTANTPRAARESEPADHEGADRGEHSDGAYERGDD